MTLYSAEAFADEAGITYRQVNYWTSRGYLSTVAISGIPTEGIGNRRIYASSEVIKARLLAHLLDRETAVDLAAKLASDHKARLPWGFVIELTEWTGKPR